MPSRDDTSSQRDSTIGGQEKRGIVEPGRTPGVKTASDSGHPLTKLSDRALANLLRHPTDTELPRH